MRVHYPFKFGILEIEYEGEVLYKLRSIPSKREPLINYDKSTDFSDFVLKQVEEYLAGSRVRWDLNYEMHGTAFQKQVWNTLLTIPYGETRSYKQIAASIGNPNASRAVGMANNKNPLLMIVPCHRVIGADGSLTGYAGGLAMKKYLLDLERNIKNTTASV